ncbi:hypothetical protein C8R21_102147 [Nitrosospira multiformis]|uniref:PEP-CTERM protein-sorting domain-containing protein n=1 Tax=Nitrosospira multiformis TaxID=1231 RepID=A0A2T5IH28_9PROT|nr:NF038129 family PEP-CTERM protein [Nitrosospira multiformis]PTQ83144.1 hypothetical protein C8R21_102147 [Nitrosospira multiformis]
MRSVTGYLHQIIISSLFLAHSAWAAPPLLFSIDTAPLSGTSGQFAFDFIDGGTPLNTVSISDFSTDGTLGIATVTGNVTGTLPATVTFSDSQFFNEVLQNVTLGSLTSFVFNSTENLPDSGSLPDAFSFFLLDSSGLPLVTTNDPTGANALFLLNIGSDNRLEIYWGDGFSVIASPIPEPYPVTLFITGLALFGVGTLYKKHNKQAV